MHSSYLDVTAACLDLCQQTASSGTGLWFPGSRTWGCPQTGPRRPDTLWQTPLSWNNTNRRVSSSEQVHLDTVCDYTNTKVRKINKRLSLYIKSLFCRKTQGRMRTPGMRDKVINWNLDRLSLQNLSQCLHDQLIVKGIWKQEEANAQLQGDVVSFNPCYTGVGFGHGHVGPCTARLVTLNPFRGTGVGFSLWALEQLPLRKACWLWGFKISQERKQEQGGRGGVKYGSKNGVNASAKNHTGKMINVAAKHAAEHMPALHILYHLGDMLESV